MTMSLLLLCGFLLWQPAVLWSFKKDTFSLLRLLWSWKKYFFSSPFTLIFKKSTFSLLRLGGQEHGLLVWGFRYKQELCARRKDKQTQQWGWFAHTQTKIVLCSSLMRILIILQAYDIRQADKTAPTQCSTEMVSIFSRCSRQALMSTQGSSTALCPMIPISMEIQPHTQQTD